MITRDLFLAALDEELGLNYTSADLDRDIDELEHWDSVHLLRLLTVFERLGAKLSLHDVLKTRTLGGLLELQVLA